MQRRPSLVDQKEESDSEICLSRAKLLFLQRCAAPVTLPATPIPPLHTEWPRRGYHRPGVISWWFRSILTLASSAAGPVGQGQSTLVRQHSMFISGWVGFRLYNAGKYHDSTLRTINPRVKGYCVFVAPETSLITVRRCGRTVRSHIDGSASAA